MTNPFANSRNRKAAALLLAFFSFTAFGAAPARGAYVLSGLDVAERQGFSQFAGKRVGIITNQTGVDRRGKSGVDVLFNSDKVKLVSIFSPEHGFRGTAEGGTHIASSTDPVTGLPIHSLYGNTRRPTSAMLAGLDVLVFDIQDVGARFYTYLTTMAMCMEEAAKRDIEFVVLDRPNPINGLVLEGPVLDSSMHDFTGYFPVPLRHGLTPGEMALLHKDLYKLDLDLKVVKLEGWNRSMYYDETGLDWVAPSPNIRNVDAALMYPAIGSFESTNLSVGRGTDSPFLWFGAPWLEAEKLADTLNAAGMPGVRVYAEDRTPDKDIYSGRLCHGIRLEITDRAAVRPMDIFVRSACALRDSSYHSFKVLNTGRSAGNLNVFKAIFDSKEPPKKIIADFEAQCRAFNAFRNPYLLY